MLLDTIRVFLPNGRHVHEAFLVETEAGPRPRPSELEIETRPRRTNSEARPSQGTTAPQDRGVKTSCDLGHTHFPKSYLFASFDEQTKRTGVSDLKSTALLVSEIYYGECQI